MRKLVPRCTCISVCIGNSRRLQTFENEPNDREEWSLWDKRDLYLLSRKATNGCLRRDEGGEGKEGKEKHVCVVYVGGMDEDGAIRREQSVRCRRRDE